MRDNFESLNDDGNGSVKTPWGLIQIKVSDRGQIEMVAHNAANPDHGVHLAHLNPWACGALSDLLLEARQRALHPITKDKEFTPEERAHIRKYLGM
jgi:hypothetical protein